MGQSFFIELNWFRGGLQETMTFTLLISELTFLMDMESIMLSQWEKDKYNIISLICEI